MPKTYIREAFYPSRPKNTIVLFGGDCLSQLKVKIKVAISNL